MAVTLDKETDALYSIKITGPLTAQEFSRLQAEAEEIIGATGKLKLLVRLEDFTGWEASEQWGDLGLFLEHDAAIEKMALVGDPRWQDELLAFTGAGYRQAEVRFFPSYALDQAYAWLA